VGLLGHAVNPAADPDILREIGSPTPVPSMQDRRIVSVATSDLHCLALGAEGEVYSWGDGECGELGHGDVDAKAVPSRIESLSRIERIAAGQNRTSAAVDEKGRLFTWGRASFFDANTYLRGFRKTSHGPSGLGYELDSEIFFQPTPKRVDALSQDRVVGVALGTGFTLTVADASAVFSCGFCRHGSLGHGSWESEVLPRRIQALAETGLRFIAVAAGNSHALALTEEGRVYGWGGEEANRHGREECMPHRVAALIGQRVKLVNAKDDSSCAVLGEGGLFTWGHSRGEGGLGHGNDAPQQFEPKRVEGLKGVEVAAVAVGWTHTLAADADGVVWAFGRRSALGLDASGPHPQFRARVLTPTLISTLRVRVLNSP